MSRVRGWARGWAARQVERPGAYSRLQRAVGSDRLWRRFVAEAIRPAPGMRILDVGCGPADVLCYLPGDVRYQGIDTHAPYIEGAIRRHGSRGRFSLERVEDLAREGNCRFDLVLMLGLLHHLDDESATSALGAATSLARRVLCLDGCRSAGMPPWERVFYEVDRGRFVRDQAGYRALAEAVSSQVETQRWTGMLRVPYTHLLMEISGSPRPAPS